MLNEINPAPKKYKNPILAAILIPVFGIGYIYLGRYVRFAVFWVARIVLSTALTLLRIRSTPSIIDLLFVLCFALDAYTIAKKENGDNETTIF
jgi:hypothetical protein